MAGLFAKAKQNSEKKTRAPKKSTTWLVGSQQQQQVSDSLRELVKINREIATLKTKSTPHKQVVYKHANNCYVRDFADQQVPPETPMIVANEDGDKVTFVVQDRSGQYGVKEENLEMLRDLLGSDAVDNMVYEETQIGFNRDILEKEGVSEAIELALEGAINGLIERGVLDGEQAASLIQVSSKTSFRPGTLQRAASITGKDTTKLSQMLDMMGSAVVRYVK